MLRRLIETFLRGSPSRKRTHQAAPAPVESAASRSPSTPSRRAVGLLGASDQIPDLWLREKGSLHELTIIVPILPGRGRFLKALLAHFEASGFSCQIIMTVNSDALQEPEIERRVAEYPRLNVRILYHPMAVHFVDRLNDCARQATTKYVFVHCDDDFVVAGTLADCVDFLNTHEDYAACQGRGFFFTIKGTELVPQAQRFLSREEDHSVRRVLEHCRRYTNTFHAVTRREAFLTSNEQTMVHTQQVIFWQYLASCWLIALGKLKVIDRLYYMRLDNPGGARAQLIKKADRSHWPYFIVAPNFSDEQERFKAGLMAAMKGQAPTEKLASVVDECCLGLIRRAFGGQLEYDPAEVEIQSRFFDSTSHEAEVARYCGPRSIECLETLAVAQKPEAATESG